jgi:precorrin-6B methylase 1
MKAIIRITKKNATPQEIEEIIKALHEAGFKDSDFTVIEKPTDEKEQQKKGILFPLNDEKPRLPLFKCPCILYLH